MGVQPLVLLDCTLRDGGYYNKWDFDGVLVQDYLNAMAASRIDYVELGLRSFESTGFRGAHAYTTDRYLRSLEIPDGLSVGVMVNASELVSHSMGVVPALEMLFSPANESPVSLVRLACHAHEVEAVLPGCQWLGAQGYKVGLNLMQVADKQPGEIERLARLTDDSGVDVLYFADSMGSLAPEQTASIVRALRRAWSGALGIHAHDNRGMALANTLRSVDEGVTWVDSTITGMGRGPGNVRTEYLLIELMEKRKRETNVAAVLELVSRYFQPMQQAYGWGTNPYYFLAGTYGIHPTYIQEMLVDPRYKEEDLLVVIDFLKRQGGKKFSPNTLESARHFFSGEPKGDWEPRSVISGREVLLLGSGPGVARHRHALEDFIRRDRPFVIALNTQVDVQPELIDVHAACHPFRLMADCKKHRHISRPLVTPAHMLPPDVKAALAGKQLLDYGLSVQAGRFAFASSHCVLPTSLVAAYALAIAASGEAKRILLAGFDGYDAGDARNDEINQLFDAYQQLPSSPPMLAITPTRYQVPSSSIYAFRGQA